MGEAGERVARVERVEWIVHAALLSWLAVRLVYLAVSLHPYVPPDEVTHLGRVIAYSAVPGIPDDGPMTFEYGLISQRPGLYYWGMGRLALLSHGLVFLRLANCVLALATACLGILWIREWSDNALVRVTFAVVLTNVPMFTGIGAAVSYDNLANLLAAASLLAFTRFRRTRSVESFLALVALVAAGCLAKRTLLPFAGVLGLLFVWREWRTLPALPAELLASLGRPRRALLAGVAIASCLLFAALYGGNLVRYGRLSPGFDQVVGVENAMKNRVFARGHIVEAFREGRLEIAEARALAGRIEHKGDRSDTLFLLKAAQLPDASLLAPLPYAVEWSRRMMRSATGYAGHRRAEKSSAWLGVYFALMGAAAVVALRRWRPGEARGATLDAALLVAGYSLVLLWLVNYPSYRESRSVELAVQGRYLFPVLVPLCGLVAHYWIAYAPTRLQPWLAAALAALALAGDLPWLLQQADPRWFAPGAP